MSSGGGFGNNGFSRGGGRGNNGGRGSSGRNSFSAGRGFDRGGRADVGISATVLNFSMGQKTSPSTVARWMLQMRDVIGDKCSKSDNR